jgi:hypothetical protein
MTILSKMAVLEEKAVKLHIHLLGMPPESGAKHQQ